VNSQSSCRLLATSKPPKKDSFWSSHQENGRGSTSRRWGLSPVCSAASSVAKSVLWGRPTHSSVSAQVPLFHMSLQVASAEALRVCAPRDPAGTLGDRPRARVAVGWPLLVKEEVGGHFSACWGGGERCCLPLMSSCSERRARNSVASALHRPPGVPAGSRGAQTLKALAEPARLAEVAARHAALRDTPRRSAAGDQRGVTRTSASELGDASNAPWSTTSSACACARGGGVASADQGGGGISLHPGGGEKFCLSLMIQ